MAKPITLTAVYRDVEDGWVEAQLAEWPAVITCAPTLDEARDMLRDAFREMVLSYTEQGEQPPVPGDAAREPLTVTIA
jgi:predicted RNase H-like HicB family nuclease